MILLPVWSQLFYDYSCRVFSRMKTDQVRTKSVTLTDLVRTWSVFINKKSRRIPLRSDTGKLPRPHSSNSANSCTPFLSDSENSNSPSSNSGAPYPLIPKTPNGNPSPGRNLWPGGDFTLKTRVFPLTGGFFPTLPLPGRRIPQKHQRGDRTKMQN